MSPVKCWRNASRATAIRSSSPVAPPGTKRPQLDVHLFVDNDSITNITKAPVARPPSPFQVHFTPIYSSWLYQAERWFALFTQRTLRRDSFSSVHKLTRLIDPFVQNYNRTRNPFAWTATADSILEKLTPLCEGLLKDHDNLQPPA